MHRHSKIVKILLFTMVLSLFIPFADVPRAEAATVPAQNDNTIFQTCIEKYIAIAAGKEAAKLTVQALIKATAVTAGTSAASFAALINVPVTNPSSAGVVASTAASDDQDTIWQTAVEPFLSESAYDTAQCALQQLTANTISWIKGGFHGSPSFAINPDKIYNDLEASVATQLSQQVLDAKVTDFVPGFSNNLTKSIQLSTRLDAKGKFTTKLTATFPPNVQPAAFYSNFNNGGWGAFQASLSDNNNPFGLVVTVGDELAARQLEAKTTQTQKLDWSKGYFDVVDTSNCDYSGGNDRGSSIKLDSTGQPDPAVYSPAIVQSMQREHCVITTPGNIISDQLTQTLGVDMTRLGLADDLNKVMTVLVGTLMQDTIKHVF